MAIQRTIRAVMSRAYARVTPSQIVADLVALGLVMESANFQFPTYEVIELARRAQSDFQAIWHILFWLAIPLSLIPPVPLVRSWIYIRCCVVTVTIWMALLAFHIAFHVPWHRTVLDIEKRDLQYDGV